MSIFSAKTGLSSILKNYSPAERERAKNAMINKVRFELPKEKGITGVINSVLEDKNYVAYNDYVDYLRETPLNDNDFLRTISEARKNINFLTPTFSKLVETLLSLDWMKRSKPAINEFCEFYVDLLVGHIKYAPFAITKLISNWVPNDAAIDEWKNGCPVEAKREELENVHKIVERILNIIPMTFDVVIDAVNSQFPYHKKSPHIIAGYLHNILWLLDYKPAFTSYVIELIFKNLLLLDVNAPRCEIEDAEFEGQDLDDSIFLMEGCNEDDTVVMRHPIAETLDICMEKMFEYIQKFITKRNTTNCATDIASFFNLIFTVFENVLLPSYNTHHVQFLIFYFCSFKSILSERFLSNLWAKVSNVNMSAPVRQASIGYIASFLARAKFTTLSTLKNYLSEMCSWAHQYIQRTDSVRTNNSLKANIVFFSICQAIFYIIAFRSKDLTNDKKSLLFLQSLQLSAIVTCNFNPLRVCIPAVATAFSGVTRAYQLAYCHTILERNARRKLATVYANEISMPEECLDTFFPFDPYLLKKSGEQITPIYLQYHANETDDETSIVDSNIRRKRSDSEVDDIDDFIIDKKQKLTDPSRSHDRELQFTYGLSPGFHI